MSKADKKETSEKTETNWSFNPDGEDDELDSKEKSVVPRKKVQTLHWETSEQHHNEKSPKWNFILALTTLVLAIIAYFATKDKITTGMIVLAGIIFGVYGNHKPEAIEYTLDDSGLTIGNKLYPLGAFRSFSIVTEANHKNLLLVPQKRFVPIIPVYFNGSDETKIIDVLNDLLPQEERGNDIVDRFLRKINY